MILVAGWPRDRCRLGTDISADRHIIDTDRSATRPTKPLRKLIGSGIYHMRQDRFLPPSAAFTRSVPVRFSHCDPAGIVYFPHYFDMFNGLIEDWYGEELGYDYAKMIMESQYAFPFVHIECDFNIPSRIGDVIELILLVEHVGHSSLGIVIVCHRDGLERLRARMVAAMISLKTGKSVSLPQALRDKIESYRRRTAESHG